MTRIVRNFLAPVLVLSLAAIIAWAMVNSRADLPRREQVTVAPSVDSVSVTPGAVPTTIRSRGTVAAKHVIELVSKVSGRVKWVDPGFLQGEQVKEGQTLLRIDLNHFTIAWSWSTISPRDYAEGQRVGRRLLSRVL